MSDASALATIGRLVRGPARRGNSRSLPVGLLAVVVVALVAPFYLDVFWLQVGVFAFAAMVAALGLNLLVGEAGQLSLAHSFFVAVGAYGYTFYASESQDVGVHAHAGWGLPPLVAVVLAVVTAGVAGLLFSPIAARLGGIYLGVASLGLVFLGQHVLVNAEPLTGGFNGRDVPPLTLLGFSFDDVPGKTLLAFRHIVPETFGVLLAIEYLAMIVIGGIGSPGGTLAGALFVSSLPVVLQRYSDALPFLAESPSGGGLTAGVAARFCYGAAIVVLLLVEPGGLAALGRRARRRFLAGTGGPAVLPAPSPAAAAGRQRRLRHPESLVLHTSLPRREPNMPSPSVPRHLLAWLTATVVVAAVAGCSSKDDEPSATAAGGDTGTTALETGPGVSDDTITLGVLTDQSGPFAGASKGIAQGRQLFWDARNADGGVCDRNVEFTVNDHAYNAQNATTLYADMQPDVLAFDELLGSPMIDALLSTDLTAAVTALEDAGASVVLLTTTPPQAASAVAVAQANGLDLTFVGSNPTFSPALLASPAAGALEASYVMVSSIAPYASDAAGPAGVREAFAAEFAGETPTHFVLYGYAQGELMAQILETACENGALTRPGLQEAFQSLDDVDTEGLVAPMDFSDPGQPPAREVHILKPDASVDGGLSEVQDLFASPLAADFQLGT